MPARDPASACATRSTGAPASCAASESGSVLTATWCSCSTGPSRVISAGSANSFGGRYSRNRVVPRTRYRTNRNRVSPNSCRLPGATGRCASSPGITWPPTGVNSVWRRTASSRTKTLAWFSSSRISDSCASCGMRRGPGAAGSSVKGSSIHSSHSATISNLPVLGPCRCTRRACRSACCDPGRRCTDAVSSHGSHTGCCVAWISVSERQGVTIQLAPAMACALRRSAPAASCQRGRPKASTMRSWTKLA